jgi:hypothetical protein
MLIFRSQNAWQIIILKNLIKTFKKVEGKVPRNNINTLQRNLTWNYDQIKLWD